MEHYLSFWQQAFDFKTRATRSQYWFAFLFNLLAVVLLTIGDAVIFAAESGAGLLSGLYTLAAFIPNIAISVRRLHDIGKSGWWYLLMLVPLVGAIVSLVFFCPESKEDNEWGPNSLASA